MNERQSTDGQTVKNFICRVRFHKKRYIPQNLGEHKLKAEKKEKTLFKEQETLFKEQGTASKGISHMAIQFGKGENRRTCNL